MNFDHIHLRKIEIFRIHYKLDFIKSEMIILDIARYDLFGVNDQMTRSLMFDSRDDRYTKDMSNIIIMIELLYVKFKEKYYNNIFKN